MPKLPSLSPGRTYRVVTDTFRGYNHNLKIADGEMYDTQNLTTDYYPLLATRRPRHTVLTTTKPGGLIAKDKLYYVDNGTLYYLAEGESGLESQATSLTGLSTGTTTQYKQLVSMGAYILVFPDKKYYNTVDSTDYGSIECSCTFIGNYDVTAGVVQPDGTAWTVIATDDEEPANPDNGDIWVDTGTKTVKMYSGTTGAWIEQSCRSWVTFTFSDADNYNKWTISEGDTVTIGGMDDMSGERYVHKMQTHTANNEYWVKILIDGFYRGTFSGTKTVKRSVPSMDFVCECQNRLWGCKYGTVDGETINEIYASALGNFKSWNQYEGISTDSWTASIGSDGPWTGAINYLGRPCFFKKDRVHVVTVSPEGAHRVDEILCSGVQDGSSKSLQIVGDTLYYKGENGVYAWQGGFPVLISQAFGDTRYDKAVGGTFNNKYYICMHKTSTDEGTNWSIFVYDTTKGLWIREDSARSMGFAQFGEELYSLNPSNKKLRALQGTVGTLEGLLAWSMETGLLYYEYPDKKYLSRYDIRLNMAEGASANIYLEYDSSGEWIENGTIRRCGTGTVTIPIRPRRCDHLRMKISGTGDVKVFSVARTLEVGSDV